MSWKKKAIRRQNRPLVFFLVSNYPRNNINNKFYLHEVIKIGAAPDTAVINNATRVNEQTPISKNSISQVEPNVKTDDEMNQLTGADFNGIIASYTYDLSGNIETKTVGNNVTTISYNKANLPISYEIKVGDTVLNSYTYT